MSKSAQVLKPQELKIKLESNSNSMELKALTVAAGYKCSLIIADNLKLFWCGSNGRIKMEKKLKKNNAWYD